MNWPLRIGTRVKRPSPALARPIRRWREGDSFAGIGIGGGLQAVQGLLAQAFCGSLTGSMQTYDVIIIGAGHNGLTCAAYLGMAGLKVKVVERRHLVGGAAVTEEFVPGFRNSIAAYTVSLLNPKVIADLRLYAHGLQIVERRAQNFVPAPDGRYLLAAEGCTKTNVAKLNRADGECYDAFNRELNTAADLLRDLAL